MSAAQDGRNVGALPGCGARLHQVGIDPVCGGAGAQTGLELAVIPRLCKQTVLVGLEKLRLAGNDEAAYPGLLVDQRVLQIQRGKPGRADPIEEEVTPVSEPGVCRQRQPDPDHGQDQQDANAQPEPLTDPQSLDKLRSPAPATDGSRT